MLITPITRSPTRIGMQMNEPLPYWGSLALLKRGSEAMSSTSTGSPISTTLPATPSPTFTSTAGTTSSGMPREAASFSTVRSRSRIMMEPTVARTARMVDWSTRPSRSWIFGIRAASSTISLSVPSLKTKSSSRCVEPRRSSSMW
jgi:hypothetical protein